MYIRTTKRVVWTLIICLSVCPLIYLTYSSTQAFSEKFLSFFLSKLPSFLVKVSTRLDRWSQYAYMNGLINMTRAPFHKAPDVMYVFTAKRIEVPHCSKLIHHRCIRLCASVIATKAMHTSRLHWQYSECSNFVYFVCLQQESGYPFTRMWILNK
jgi:hypothetical protein